MHGFNNLEASENIPRDLRDPLCCHVHPTVRRVILLWNELGDPDEPSTPDVPYGRTDARPRVVRLRGGHAVLLPPRRRREV